MIRVYVESQGASAFVGRFINPDRLPLSVRFAALKDMEGIFQRWPDGFITYCQERGISYSSISPMAKTNGGVVPYWVEEAIKKHIYFPNIEPSDVSVLAAIDVMKRDGLRASISSVNRFMGFTDSRVIKKVIKTVRES
ncbi:hypothetical protein VH1807_contig00006-0008 [Vibrio harveyi]|nr:hypothetical protein VH1807_contig00006-0008 [Vibrio harveyi]